MSVKVIDSEGREFEWNGEYRQPHKGEWMLGLGGEYLCPALEDYRGVDGIRAIVHPIPKRHVFGNVVFEETGEFRSPCSGEWWLSAHGPTPCFNGFKETQFRILRPVGVES